MPLALGAFTGGQKAEYRRSFEELESTDQAVLFDPVDQPVYRQFLFLGLKRQHIAWPAIEHLLAGTVRNAAGPVKCALSIQPLSRSEQHRRRAERSFAD